MQAPRYELPPLMLLLAGCFLSAGHSAPAPKTTPARHQGADAPVPLVGQDYRLVKDWDLGTTVTSKRQQFYTRYFHTLHGDKQDPSSDITTVLDKYNSYHPPFDFADGFHTSSVPWTSDTIMHYVDGVLIAKRRMKWRHSDGSEAAPAHVLVNLCPSQPRRGGCLARSAADPGAVPFGAGDQIHRRPARGGKIAGRREGVVRADEEMIHHGCCTRQAQSRHRGHSSGGVEAVGPRPCRRLRPRPRSRIG